MNNLNSIALMRGDGIKARRSENDSVLLYNTATDELHFLNATAKMIFVLADGRSVAQVYEDFRGQIAAKYAGVDEDSLFGDFMETVKDLKNKNLFRAQDMYERVPYKKPAVISTSAANADAMAEMLQGKDGFFAAEFAGGLQPQGFMLNFANANPLQGTNAVSLQGTHPCRGSFPSYCRCSNFATCRCNPPCPRPSSCTCTRPFVINPPRPPVVPPPPSVGPCRCANYDDWQNAGVSNCSVCRNQFRKCRSCGHIQREMLNCIACSL